MEFLRCLSGKISPKGADIPLAEKPANIEGLPNRQLYVSQRILDNKSLVNCTITSLTRGPYFLWRSLRARWYCSFPWLPGTRYWKPFISFTMSRKAKIFFWKVLTKLLAIHWVTTSREAWINLQNVLFNWPSLFSHKKAPCQRQLLFHEIFHLR